MCGGVSRDGLHALDEVATPPSGKLRGPWPVCRHVPVWARRAGGGGLGGRCPPRSGARGAGAGRRLRFARTNVHISNIHSSLKLASSRCRLRFLISRDSLRSSPRACGPSCRRRRVRVASLSALAPPFAFGHCHFGAVPVSGDTGPFPSHLAGKSRQRMPRSPSQHVSTTLIRIQCK